MTWWEREQDKAQKFPLTTLLELVLLMLVIIDVMKELGL